MSAADKPAYVITLALWTTVVVTFHRCFSTTPGRHRIVPSEVFHGPQLQTFAQLDHLRDKTLAHSVSTADAGAVGLIPGAGYAILAHSAFLPPIGSALADKSTRLIDAALTHASERLDEAEEHLAWAGAIHLKPARETSIGDVDLTAFDLDWPTDVDDGRTRTGRLQPCQVLETLGTKRLLRVQRTNKSAETFDAEANEAHSALIEPRLSIEPVYVAVHIERRHERVRASVVSLITPRVMRA